MKKIIIGLLSIFTLTTSAVSAVNIVAHAEGETCPTCGTSDYHYLYTKKEATCSESGIEDWQCQSTTCGVHHDVTIPALGHDYTKSVIKGRGENIVSGDIYDCTTQVVAYHLCSRCDDIGTTTFVYREAGAHTWGEWETTTAATCTTDGSKTRTCTVCPQTETQTIPATGHTWGEWIITKEATCKGHINGSKTRSCTVCSESEIVTIPSPDHIPSSSYTVVKLPTCTETGRANYNCAVCGVSVKQITLPATPATGPHTWGEWTTTTAATCTANGAKERTCSKCNANETQTITALGHDYTKSVIKGRGENIASGDIYDCTTEVTAYHLCSRCDAIGTTTFVYREAGAHTWGEWETTTAATCTTEGSKTRTCTVCPESETQTIPTIPHDYSKRGNTLSDIVSGDIHNCATPVVMAFRCSKCDKLSTSELDTYVYREAGAHKAKKYYHAPTCTESGSSGEECENCGKDLKSDYLPPLGHNFNEERVCSRCGVDADYIIKFFDHDGKKIDETTSASGEAIDFPSTNPQRRGYSFAGWFYYDDAGEYVKVDRYQTVKADMEIYAYYEAIYINVYITDSVTGKTTTYKVLDSYTLGESLKPVEHNGYKFLGYTRDGANIDFSTDTPITEEYHLTANYEITAWGQILDFFQSLSIWTIVIIVIAVVVLVIVVRSNNGGNQRRHRR